MNSRDVGRRAFLARIGLVGAATATGGLLPRGLLDAAHASDELLPSVVDLLRPVLAGLSRDTMNGLVAFVVPGPDAYSRAQGTPSDTPGGMEARASDFMIDSLDNFVPFPDEIARPVAAALASGLAGSDVPLVGALPTQVATLDRALSVLLRNDATLPLSWPIASLLNLGATRVRPTSVSGAFLSPFANLSFAEKAAVVELIEDADADLVATFDAEFPDPLKSSVSGLLRFVGGALVEFATFGSFCEYAVFDPRTKELSGRPVGWRLTGYQPDGPAEGWDTFIGYYQGRKEVESNA